MAFRLRALLFSLFWSLSLLISAQPYFKLVPTNAFGIPILKSAYPVCYNYGEDNIQVAFEAYFGNPTRSSIYFGNYSSQGDLLNWHEVGGSSFINFSELQIYDSLYLTYTTAGLDSLKISMFNFQGLNSWESFVKSSNDPYGRSLLHPRNHFVESVDEYYGFVESLDGTLLKNWKGDSLRSALSNSLGGGTVMSIYRLGSTDTCEYFQVIVNNGTSPYDSWLFTYKKASNCWLPKYQIGEFECITRSTTPLFLRKSESLRPNDSSLYSFQILNITLDTLWSYSRTEESSFNLNSQQVRSSYEVTRNFDGYLLFERSHTRRYDNGNLLNQYQRGIRYFVLDSLYNDILETTIWPYDSFSAFLDVLSSANLFVYGNSLFKVSTDSSLYVCINTSTRGLGEPLPWLFRTEKHGVSFLEFADINSLNSKEFSIYPNPVSDLLHINYASKEPIFFSLFGASGQVLLSGELPLSKEVSLDFLPAGVYRLKVISGRDTYLKLIVKSD